MIHETWKAAPGWEGWYEVSDAGRVRSLDRSIEVRNAHGEITPRRFQGKVLAAGPSGSGYRLVTFTRPGARQQFNVHALVMLAFRGPPPNGLEVCHNDGVKVNCALSNLRYDTRKANAADTTAHGHRVTPEGEASGAAKLNVEAVQFIRTNAASGARALARSLGVSHTTVCAVIKGKSWKSVTAQEQA